jgi:hypothetical protein
MTFKIGLGAAQRERPALLLNKSHGLRIAHRFAGVGAVRPREFRREPETHQTAADNCFRLHKLKLACLPKSDKPNGALFRLQLREQDHVADAFLAEEHHAEAVNADADAAGGGHAVFEGDEEIFVQLLLLAAGLMFQRGALLNGVVLLGITGGNFLAVDAALEDFDGRRRAARVLWADA